MQNPISVLIGFCVYSEFITLEIFSSASTIEAIDLAQQQLSL